MTDKIIFNNLNSDVKKLIEKGDFKHWQVAMWCLSSNSDGMAKKPSNKNT